MRLRMRVVHVGMAVGKRIRRGMSKGMRVAVAVGVVVCRHGVPRARQHCGRPFLVGLGLESLQACTLMG